MEELYKDSKVKSRNPSGYAGAVGGDSSQLKQDLQEKIQSGIVGYIQGAVKAEPLPTEEELKNKIIGIISSSLKTAAKNPGLEIDPVAVQGLTDDFVQYNKDGINQLIQTSKAAARRNIRRPQANFDLMTVISLNGGLHISQELTDRLMPAHSAPELVFKHEALTGTGFNLDGYNAAIASFNDNAGAGQGLFDDIATTDAEQDRVKRLKEFFNQQNLHVDADKLKGMAKSSEDIVDSSYNEFYDQFCLKYSKNKWNDPFSKTNVGIEVFAGALSGPAALFGSIVGLMFRSSKADSANGVFNSLYQTAISGRRLVSTDSATGGDAASLSFVSAVAATESPGGGLSRSSSAASINLDGLMA